MGDDELSSKAEASASPPPSRGASPHAAIKYAKQAEKLSYVAPDHTGEGSGTAIEAKFVTPQDPVIITANGERLPDVPLAEAEKLNAWKAEVEGQPQDIIDATMPTDDKLNSDQSSGSEDSTKHDDRVQRSGEGSLRKAMPPSKTNPLFPPLPLYGPSSITRDFQCLTFRASSFVLSLAFLGIIVLGSAFTSIPLLFKYSWSRIRFRDPNASRPFYEEEQRRKRIRSEEAKAWKKHTGRRNSETKSEDNEDKAAHGQFIPTEGGTDPLKCDAAYYARRVGLDIEEFKVQTEDGFIITLWHVYNPLEYNPLPASQRAARGPEIFNNNGPSRSPPYPPTRKPKFPVLMIHGLLQSAGAYCTNDDASLAFYLCKSGYDVWLGNNRCGFHPEHTLLSYGDPRMWAWNIRQMGVMDLPALTSRVLSETGFKKLGLIAHSQGTTETFVALAKEQRPELGGKLTVFCALAPAAYAGPLIGKAYFKFMRMISPSFFRLIFGIHAFIPFMMTMHRCLPGSVYSFLGYRIFSFLFDWSDARWDKGIRDRMFQFAPVYVSAESMRWWLGRECFAKQKCILSTREASREEDAEDAEEEAATSSDTPSPSPSRSQSPNPNHSLTQKRRMKGSTAWYNYSCPPFALWVAGSDDLVDGKKLLGRFERGREPHVKVVYSKVIDEYEHLDVIWAMDVIEKVGKDMKDVLWKTCDVREKVRIPNGCEQVEHWEG